ncbi:MAG: hypothetical protein MRZ79_27385 [Bacteroidia bacterium]|nr:hypothetical protein [Bacteroidia bacterium]
MIKHSLIAHSQGSKLFQHGGKMPDSQFVAFTETGNSVVIMTNEDNGYYLIPEILRGKEDC